MTRRQYYLASTVVALAYIVTFNLLRPLWSRVVDVTVAQGILGAVIALTIYRMSGRVR